MKNLHILTFAIFVTLLVGTVHAETTYAEWIAINQITDNSARIKAIDAILGKATESQRKSLVGEQAWCLFRMGKGVEMIKLLSAEKFTPSESSHFIRAMTGYGSGVAPSPQLEFIALAEPILMSVANDSKETVNSRVVAFCSLAGYALDKNNVSGAKSLMESADKIQVPDSDWVSELTRAYVWNRIDKSIGSPKLLKWIVDFAAADGVPLAHVEAAYAKMDLSSFKEPAKALKQILVAVPVTPQTAPLLGRIKARYDLVK